MGTGDLMILAPDRLLHGEAVCDLAGKAFSTGQGYYAMHDFCRRGGYILGSHYDWSASRVGLVDGRLVAHFGVWDWRMRIGSARVRVGGIGAVATDAECRKRGYMARTAQAAVEAMRDLGYDLSLLFGIHNFYHRFGYVRAWSRATYTVRREDLPAGRPPGRVRRFLPVEREDISRIYNRENATRTGTAVRPTYLRCMYPKPMEGYLWADARGRTAGYVVLAREGPGRMECVEAGGDTGEVLRALASLAGRWGCPEVQFRTFSDAHPLMRRLRQGDCRVEVQHVTSGGAMVAVIRLASTLGKMAGELGRRLRASPLAAWRGRLRVDDGREAATLAIDRSRVRVVAEAASRRRGGAGRAAHVLRGGDHVAQLLIGTDAPDAVLDDAGMTARGEARALARVLFPNQDPQLNLRDRF